MQLNKQLLADLPAAQPTNPALKLPPLKGMGTSFVSQAQDKDWDMPRRRRALGAAQRKLNYQNAMRRWKKSGGLFGLYRGPRPQAPAAPLPELAPYVKGVLTWGLAKLFDESKVRRDEDGKFAPKGDAAPRSRLTGLAPRERSVASIYSRGPQWEPGEVKTYDWSRSVRPTKDMPFATRQAYAAYRSELDRSPPPPATEAAAWAEMPEPPQLPTAGGTRFKMMVQRPQVPSTMSQEQYIELARWAAQRTREERDEHIKRSIGRNDPGGHKHKMLLPADANPKDPDIRFAFNVARNIAMHNVGLFHYDYQMTPETIQAMQPYKAFIKHTARKLGDVLRSERPGVWAQFRREFGQEFKDGRTYKFDTAGQVTGEKKKFFLRHEPAVKAALNWGLAKAFGNPDLTQAEIEQRRNAARARWARVAGRSATSQKGQTVRSVGEPGRDFERVPMASFEGDYPAARDAAAEWEKLHQQMGRIRNKGLVPQDGVFVRTRPMPQADQARLTEIKRRAAEIRPQAIKALVYQKGREAEMEYGPRWRYTGFEKFQAKLSREEGKTKGAKTRADAAVMWVKAEDKHRARVRQVRAARQAEAQPKAHSAIPRQIEAPRAEVKMTPAGAAAGVRFVRLSGRSGAVAAGVIGGAALGYGLSRWRQRPA
jgi:hypothetical protein